MPDHLDDLLVHLGIIDGATGEVNPEIPGPERDEAPEAPSRTGKSDVNWESDDNPYRQRVREMESSTPSIGQQLEAHKAQLVQWADEALSEAVRRGIPQPAAEALIRPQLDAEIARAELQANRQATLPTVRRQAAEDVAKKVSDKAITVNPDELLGETTLAGMQARAKALYEERRRFKYDSRRERKVDVAEGAPATSSSLANAVDSLQPTNKIAVGLRRGDVK